ncbi:hypothetical protein D3C85_1519270 [compost metagenome]
MHRRHYGGAADPVFDGDAGGGDFRQLRAFFVEFLGGFGAEHQFRLVDLALDFVDGGFRAWDGQAGGVHGTAHFDGAAFEAKDFHR